MNEMLRLLEQIHKRLEGEELPSERTNLALSEIVAKATEGLDDTNAIQFLASALAIECWTCVQQERKHVQKN